MSDMVTLTLAHPMTAKQVQNLRATDPKDLPTGSKITLPRDDARSLITAGYAAGVDPEDSEAVNAALNGTDPTPTASVPAAAPAPKVKQP